MISIEIKLVACSVTGLEHFRNQVSEYAQTNLITPNT